MEHQQRPGSEAEDGGLRSRLRDSSHHPSDVPGDSGEVRGSSSIGLQKRWQDGDSDLETIL